MKKIAVVAVIILLICVAVPAGVVFASHSVGTNVKSDDGTIYFLSPDGTRRPYSSAGAFSSYGFNSWRSVVHADLDDLAMPVGAIVPPQDGKIVCSDRGQDKGTCYLISSGAKYAFTSAKVFYGQGFNFKKALLGDVSFLSTAGQISTAGQAHMPGVLIKKAGTVYLVTENGLFGIPSKYIFDSWGFAETDVVPANSADGGSYFSVVGNLSSRSSGDLSPLPSPYAGGVPVTNSNAYVQVKLGYGSITSVKPGDKQVEIFRATITAPASAPVSVSQIDLEFDGDSATSTLSNFTLVNGNTNGVIGSLSGSLGMYNSIGFGMYPVYVNAGQSFDLVLKADIGSNALNSSFYVKMNNLYTLSSDNSASRLASAQGLPLVGNMIMVKKTVVIGPITSPAATDVWQAGSTYTIRWQANAADSSVQVGIAAVPVKTGCSITSLDTLYQCIPQSALSQSFTEKNMVITETALNTGSYTWTVPASWPSDFTSTVVLIAPISDGYDSTIFSPVFSIISHAPGINILLPKGGEVYQAGTTIPVNWTTSNIPSNIAIRDVFLIDQSGKEIYVTSDLPNTGSANISLPASLSDGSYTLELRTVVNGGLISNITNDTFTITASNSSYFRDSKRLADVRTIASALELYYSDHGSYPYALSQMSPAYIGSVPSAPGPADGTCSYVQNSYLYSQNSSGQNYTLTFCLGGKTGGYALGAHTLSAAGIQ